jgi:hypothetical protein
MKYLAYLVLLTCLAYLPSLAGAFVYEDAQFLAGVQQPFYWGQLWGPRALTLAAFRLNGTDPFWWHIGNLSVHLLNGLLLWLIARRWFVESTALLLVGIFWLHPMQTESVAYLSGRGELLCATGLLLTLWSESAWLIVLGGLLALGTKEASAIGPLCLIAWQKRAWLPVAVWSVIARLFARALPPMPVADLHWMAAQVALAGTYSARWLWPASQSVQAPLVQPWAGAAFVFVTGGLIWFTRSRTAGLWLLLALLPRIVLAQPRPVQPEPLHEHHFYIALIGVLLGLAAAWPAHKESPCYVAA